MRIILVRNGQPSPSVLPSAGWLIFFQCIYEIVVPSAVTAIRFERAMYSIHVTENSTGVLQEPIVTVKAIALDAALMPLVSDCKNKRNDSFIVSGYATRCRIHFRQ